MLVKVTNLCNRRISRSKALSNKLYSSSVITLRGIKIGLKDLPPGRSKVIDNKFITKDHKELVEMGALRIKPIGDREELDLKIKPPKSNKPKKKLELELLEVINKVIEKPKTEIESIIEEEPKKPEIEEGERVVFTKEELEGMTRKEVINLGEDLGYDINKRSKSDCIDQFLELQELVEEAVKESD